MGVVIHWNIIWGWLASQFQMLLKILVTDKIHVITAEKGGQEKLTSRQTHLNWKLKNILWVEEREQELPEDHCLFKALKRELKSMAGDIEET